MYIGNVEVYGIIYKITNLINGKVYIGQTIQGFNKRYKARGSDIERVYKSNKRLKDANKRYCRHLFNAINKYGFEAFEVIKIFDVAFSKEELDIKEKHYIKQYNSNNGNFGYNITSGGEGFMGYDIWKNKTQDEIEQWKRKISISRTGNPKVCGKNNPMYGRPWWNENTPQEKIDEWKDNIRKANSGENNYFYGKHHTEETKRKISEKNKEKSKGLKNKKSIKYILIDLEGNEIVLCGKDLYNDHSNGFLNVDKRVFDKYIRPYGNIDIDRINKTPRSMITIKKLKPYNGWKVIEATK